MTSVILMICIIILALFAACLVNYIHKLKYKINVVDEEIQKQNEICTNMFELVKENMNTDNNNAKDLLLKQQEATTKIEGISDNYRMLLQQINELSKTNVKTDTVVTDISSKISSMNDIMVNKKSRGNWGEYQLNSLLSLYAGDNREVFKPQYSLKNGFIGDAALFLPDTNKVLMIDSKFPMENYQNIINEKKESERVRFERLFIANIKKHVNDIANKYITAETTEQAVMFIPSEAIFTYICSEHSDLIDYAQRNHVLITSPTTLIGVVFTLVNITKDFNRAKNIKKIEKQIISLSDDAQRLEERVESTEASINTALKNITNVKVSSSKINKTIKKVSDGYIEEEDMK